MRKLLILSQWIDYMSASIYHYSISKGFNIAAGFTGTPNVKTYYLTLGPTEEYNLSKPSKISEDARKTEESAKNPDDLVQTKTHAARMIYLINANEVDTQFLESLDYILFIKEVEMFTLLEKMPAMKDLCLKKDRKQKIGVKSGSLAWIRTENNVCKQLFGFGCQEFALNNMDLLYVQTPEFKTVDFQKFCGKNPKLLKKIFISPMGVNNYIEEINGSNPYLIDHSYCVKKYDPKIHSHNQIALFPIPILPLLERPDDDPEKRKP